MSVYKPILEARVNALLMIEDTMNFYQYNIDLKPSEVTHFAMSYLVKILNTLLKHNKDLYKEISKQLKKASTRFVGDKGVSAHGAGLIEGKSCDEIVYMFNDHCRKSTFNFEESKVELTQADEASNGIEDIIN